MYAASATAIKSSSSGTRISPIVRRRDSRFPGVTSQPGVANSLEKTSYPLTVVAAAPTRERSGASFVHPNVEPGRQKVKGDHQSREQNERPDPDERNSGIVTILETAVENVPLRDRTPAAAQVDRRSKRHESLAERTSGLGNGESDGGIIDARVGGRQSALLVDRRRKTLVENASLRSGEIERITLQQRAGGKGCIAAAVPADQKLHPETVAGLVIKRPVDIDWMVHADGQMPRHSVVSRHGYARDVIDGLVDHPALGHDRRNLVRKVVQTDDGVRPLDLRRLPREQREFTRKTARPVERRACRDNDEAGVRDEDAAPCPVVFVGEAPLDSTEDSLAHSPAALAQQLGDAAANVGRFTVSIETVVKWDLLDAHRAQGREAGRNDALERADRQREQDQSDDADVPRGVIDVVEAQAQDGARDRRRIALKVKIGVLP